jgi:hypothetical protein
MFSPRSLASIAARSVRAWNDDYAPTMAPPSPTTRRSPWLPCSSSSSPWLDWYSGPNLAGPGAPARDRSRRTPPGATSLVRDPGSRIPPAGFVDLRRRDRGARQMEHGVLPRACLVRTSARARFSRHLGALLPRLAQADRDSLLATRHTAAGAALERSAFATMHGRLHGL